MYVCASVAAQCSCMVGAQPGLRRAPLPLPRNSSISMVRVDSRAAGLSMGRTSGLDSELSRHHYSAYCLSHELSQDRAILARLWVLEAPPDRAFRAAKAQILRYVAESERRLRQARDFHRREPRRLQTCRLVAHGREAGRAGRARQPLLRTGLVSG